MTSFEKVLAAREADRPKAKYFIKKLFTDIVYLKGDRCSGEDASLVGGIAFFRKQPVTFLATDKGDNLEERIQKNFGMPNPQGYRKARRLMLQAQKFHRPVITFIDTPGAYPGVEAEKNGQGEAIAQSILQMTGLEVPIITVITGEACSGGALAIAVADKILIYENAYYSILSPEGFSSILFKDASKVEESSELMRLTATDLKKEKVIDEIISEDNFENSISTLRDLIRDALRELSKLSKSELLHHRKQKFHHF